MNNTTIRHSGDYLRLFAATNMSKGAMRVATALAAHISFERGYRGAPVGWSAFTMEELATMANVCTRTVRRALDELTILFGLNVKRRHHARHLFRFENMVEPTDPTVEDDEDPIEAEPLPSEVTGHKCPTSLYTQTNRNNDKRSMIVIQKEAGSVHQSDYAEIIKEAKKGTAAEATDPDFLWKGFHMLNARNGNAVAPVAWLKAFVRKAKPAFLRSAPEPKPTVSAASTPTRVDPILKLSAYAKIANRHFHEMALVRAIGRPEYDQRVSDMMVRYGANRFSATLAVHGLAVKKGEIES